MSLKNILRLPRIYYIRSAPVNCSQRLLLLCRFIDMRMLYFVPLVAEVANTTVDQLLWPGGWSWMKALIFISVFVGCGMHQRNDALAKHSEEERRRHVYEVVFPNVLKLAAPFIILTAEPLACYFRHQPFSNEFYSCDGIAIGNTPLVMIMVLIASSQILFIGSESILSVENLCKLKMSCIEAYQLASFGLCSAYAFAMYALRKERVVHWDGDDGHFYTSFTAILVTGVVLGFCKKKKQSQQQGTKPCESKKSSLWTAQGRKSNDVRKSLWDNGTKGAIGSGALKNASKRGIVKERLSGEESKGGVGKGGRERGISDAAFHPGFM